MDLPDNKFVSDDDPLDSSSLIRTLGVLKSEDSSDKLKDDNP